MTDRGRIDSEQHPPGGVLSGREIRDLGLISEDTADWDKCLKPASYDLRFGSDVLVCGTNPPEVRDLQAHRTTYLTIEPFESVLFSTKERVRLPQGVVGRFDLKIGFALQGLIMQVGPQVMPAYEGPLFGLILNTSGAPRSIKPGEPFASIEFSRTTSMTEADRESILDLEEFFRANTPQGMSLADKSVIACLRDELKGYQAKIDEEIKGCRESHGVRLQEKSAASASHGVLLSKWSLAIGIVGFVAAVVFGVTTLVVADQRASLPSPRPTALQSAPPKAKPTPTPSASGAYAIPMPETTQAVHHAT